MNKWFILLIVAVLWSSCSNKNEYEIVSSEEVLPQAQGSYEYEDDSINEDKIELNPSETLLLQVFPDVNFDEENTLKNREMLFIPNRLGFKNKEETYFNRDSISYHFIEWEFEDSLKTVNAFYNWLDCFGHNCRSIRIEEEKNGSKEAFVIWVTNNKITYIASSKNINRKTWQETFFGEEKNTWNYIIYQGRGGKMKWIIDN